MKYMLLIYGDEQALDENERDHCYEVAAQAVQKLKATGQYLDAAPLHPTKSAASVRVRAGKSLVTDGPFAETREQLGGFFLVEAADHDEAVSIALQLPMAEWGTIEVRPIIEVTSLTTG